MSVEVLSQVCTVMRARRAQLVLAEPEASRAGSPWTTMGPPRSSRSTSTPSSIITQAIQTGVASLHTTTTPHRRSSYDPIAGRYVHAIVAPIVNENTAIGAIVALDRDEELDGFDEDDLRLFEALVAHASANLERARLVEELRYEVDSKSHQATHDMLTGLPNRTLFLSRATSALNGAAASPSSCSTSTGSRTSTTRWAMQSVTGSSARCPSACCVRSASRPQWPVSGVTSSPS